MFHIRRLLRWHLIDVWVSVTGDFELERMKLARSSDQEHAGSSEREECAALWCKGSVMPSS